MISRIRLFNFLCFRGEHVVDLKSFPYAVCAKRENDTDRSNASGKTAFLEAFGFALWGRHRHRSEDAWISRGEARGEVELTLGTVRILRSRERGKATRLHVFDGDREFTKADAETRVREIVGFGEVDYYATRHLEQRQIARFVLSRPEERMESVSAWVGLTSLERAERIARDNLVQASSRLDQADKERARWKDRLDTALEGSTLESIRNEEKLQLARLRTAIAEVDKARRVLVSAEVAESFQVQEVEYAQLVEDGKALAATLKRTSVDTLQQAVDTFQQALDAKTLELGQWKTKAIQLEGPAKGTFDGQCPIAKLECPAVDKINADRVSARALYAEAIKARDDLQREIAGLRSELQEASFKLQTHQRDVARLEDMRARAKEVREQLANRPDGSSVSVTDARAKLDEVTAHHASIVQEVSRYAWRLTAIGEATIEIERAEAGIKALRDDEAVASSAVLIFGRNGAQKMVAESALSQIEARANEALSACGIDLSVQVRWSREGQGLATTCDACGHPFPASTKVKVCGRCEASRGPKLIHRLDVDLSDRSGALEDLAGLVVSLSAGAWLRDSRNIGWGTILIDEAWGQLDTAHRRILSSGLPRMFASWGAEQAFITAHHHSVLDALPGRIEVARKGDWSEVRVMG